MNAAQMSTRGILLVAFLCSGIENSIADEAIPASEGAKLSSTQKEWAREHNQAVEMSNSVGMKLRLIPPGKFRMGSTKDEADRIESENLHDVRITRAFYLGKYEVTQSEWKAVMSTEPWTGRDFVKAGSDYPVSYVSWKDATEFCNKLSRAEGALYRLPTEAEWEYSCRGGDSASTRFHFGNDDANLSQYAWYGAYDGGNAANEPYAHRVGQKNGNRFGLHDMHGNLWEWCADRFDPKFYFNSPVNDPRGNDAGMGYVIRGGDWGFGPKYCRSALRCPEAAFIKLGTLGFRVVRELPAK